MSTVIRLPENLYKRLEKYAKGFDTPVQVIERLLNEFEGVEYSPEPERSNSNDTLEIRLSPANIADFKQELLKKKRAEITVYYTNGSTEVKSWKAVRFTEESDVIGNLRSRKEFRQDAWKRDGIKYIAVSV